MTMSLFDRSLRFLRCCPAQRRAALLALLLLVSSVKADPPAKSSDPQSDAKLNTITVKARRQTLERQVSAFVSAISIAPSNEALARWENPTFICPLVGGLPRDDGEFILTRLSSIALAAGAPLGSAHCKPNFYIICVFRSMPAPSSGACRAMIPVHVGPPFRSMPAGGCDAG